MVGSLIWHIYSTGPREMIDDSDWEKVRGWKESSIVSVSLDAGLRPAEVRNAPTRWIDLPDWSAEDFVLGVPQFFTEAAAYIDQSSA